MVWLVERLPVIYFKEDDSNPPFPPLEKVEPKPQNLFFLM
jgi:hypothetical protein